MDSSKIKPDLSEERLKILRDKGTEAPFSGELLYNSEQGMYTCGACGQELFSSATKFDSHCGWPSFYDGVGSGAMTLVPDMSHGMERTEVVCSNCGGHLGHVFEDAPEQPTGLRYCINSLSLDFKPDAKD